LEIRLETSLSLHLSLEKYSWSVTINIIKNWRWPLILTNFILKK
jgi:hypothetical protein